MQQKLQRYIQYALHGGVTIRTNVDLFIQLKVQLISTK